MNSAMCCTLSVQCPSAAAGHTDEAMHHTSHAPQPSSSPQKPSISSVMLWSACCWSQGITKLPLHHAMVNTAQMAAGCAQAPLYMKQTCSPAPLQPKKLEKVFLQMALTAEHEPGPPVCQSISKDVADLCRLAQASRQRPNSHLRITQCPPKVRLQQKTRNLKLI